jgi:hypothetical protein
MFAQFIFSNLLQAKSKYAIKCFAFLRLVYLKFTDPIVVWNYHGQEIAMNLSHDLPFNIKQYPTYSQNLGEVAAIIAKKYPEFSVIDVGANVGDSAAIVQHQVKVPVLCIEGNPKFLPLLKQNSQKLFKISFSLVSGIATTKSLINFERNIREICNSIIGFPQIGINTLPGSLVDSIRA